MCCNAGKFVFAGVAALFVAASVGYVIAQKMPAQMEAESEMSKTIVATVNGEPVYLSEISDFWQSNNQLKSAPLELVYRDIMNAVLEEKALSAQARRDGLEKSKEYQADLEKIKEQVLIASYIKKKLDDMMTDEALKAEYDKFVAQNPTEDEVQASHILVDSEDVAKKIIDEIKKGADFAEMAAKHSIDSNGKTGGKLDYFKKGDMVPEFANAVFAMNVGDVTDKPIKTMFGWHVVKVTDRRKSAAPSFEQVKDYLKMKLSEELYPSIIKQAKENAGIIFMPAAYKNVLIDISGDDEPIAKNDVEGEEDVMVEEIQAEEDEQVNEVSEENVSENDQNQTSGEEEVVVEIMEGADNKAISLKPETKDEEENAK